MGDKTDSELAADASGSGQMNGTNSSAQADSFDRSSSASLDKEQVKQKFEELWPQLRKLLVFQVKLYVEAARDLFLSAISLGAFLVDLVLGKSGPDSYFERVLKLGRRSELAINLFNQHDPEEQGAASVDSVLQGVEDRIRR